MDANAIHLRDQKIDRAEPIGPCMPTRQLKATFVLIARIVADSGGALAIEHHKLRECRRVSDCFSVTGDGVFRFGHGRILIPQYGRRQSAIQRFPVAPQRVIADAKGCA